jgi:anti-sigma B factor antagonist
VTAPDEIDVSNAGDVAKKLRSALRRGATVVVDLSATQFCDSAGLRVLLLGYDWATADGARLRLAAPPGATRDVLQIMGLDRKLPVYPSLATAVAGDRAWERPSPGPAAGTALPRLAS